VSVEPQPGDRRFDTIRAHVADASGATRARKDGRRAEARDPSPKGGRTYGSGPWRTRLKRRDRQERIDRSNLISSPDEVGGKPEHDREVVAGDERQEGSRP
jgi:hypothetical protein